MSRFLGGVKKHQGKDKTRRRRERIRSRFVITTTTLSFSKTMQWNTKHKTVSLTHRNFSSPSCARPLGDRSKESKEKRALEMAIGP